ncbi:MAG: ABC transporter permease [Thermoanaerobaculia bacterium]|nr:ABC transporter permease [Thermoanaerobaculia bacterium]
MTARDLRLSARSLARRPLFSLSVVTLLAVAIGTVTAVYTVSHEVLLRPMDFGEPDQLVALWARTPGDLERRPLTSWDLVQLRDHVGALSGVAGYYQRSTLVRSGDTAQRVLVARTTANLFETLGISPFAGRFFDGRPGLQEVVISHRLFQQHFAGRHGNLADGELELEIFDGLHQVVGVLPPSSDPLPSPGRSPDPVDAFIPFFLDLEAPDRKTGWLRSVARLADGANRQQLEQELDQLSVRTAEIIPERIDSGYAYYHLPLLDDIAGPARPALAALLFSALAMFAIACTNIVGLLLARGRERVGEVAIRRALGCPPIRILTTTTSEAVLLVLAAGGIGPYFAHQLLALARAGHLLDLPRAAAVSIGPAALTIAGGLTAVALAIFLLAVSRQIGGNGSLRPCPQTARVSHRAGRWLLTVESGLAMVLLVFAGLLVRSVQHLRQVDPGSIPEVSSPSTSRYPPTWNEARRAGSGCAPSKTRYGLCSVWTMWAWSTACHWPVESAPEASARKTWHLTSSTTKVRRSTIASCRRAFRVPSASASFRGARSPIETATWFW